MRSPRKSIVERKKSQEPKRELGVCCHSGTGEEVSSLDMGGGGEGRNVGGPGAEGLGEGLEPTTCSWAQEVEVSPGGACALDGE